MKDNNPPTADKTGTPSPKKPGRTARLAILIGLPAVLLGGVLIVVNRPKAPSEPPPVVNIVTQPIPRPDTLVTEPIADKPVKEKVKKNTVKAKAIEVKEAFNPAKYLTSSIKTRKNVIGQAVIGGYITNLSSSMIFKDIVLDVSYLSKTDAVISTQRFVVYEIIMPGKKAAFKFKTKQPPGTKTYTTHLVTATEVK